MSENKPFMDEEKQEVLTRLGDIEKRVDFLEKQYSVLSRGKPPVEYKPKKRGLKRW